MAEILLSLTIIGVVAAITLPSLTGNINERTWNTQRKALYARISQALSLMPNLNGYGTYQLANADTNTSAEDTAAESFVSDGLSKVLKINNICNADHLSDCGIISSYTNLLGNSNSWPTKLSELNSMFTGTFYINTQNGTGGEPCTNPLKDIDTKAVAFETQNGETIAVYYNPHCQADMQESTWHYAQPKMCANFIYDLNGKKGPNTVGKDIGFITALYPTDPVVVAPMPISKYLTGKTQTEAGKECNKVNQETRLPNRDELSALFFNRSLIGIEGEDYWSSSVISFDASGTAWSQNFSTGRRCPSTRTNATGVCCIKR